MMHLNSFKKKYMKNKKPKFINLKNRLKNECKGFLKQSKKFQLRI